MKAVSVVVGLAVAVSAITAGRVGADAKEDMLRVIEEHREDYAAWALQIWDWAELGYQEERSSALLRRQVEEAGFVVETGVAGIPTSFIATYGQGEPVIGILAEFDALPGLSQEAVPLRQSRHEGGAGHACGHHLFGAASTAAAIAVRHWLEQSGSSGTVRLYGTPAEEGGSGKVYMGREGLFDGVDAVLHWHPRDRNDASPYSTNANKSAKFRFYGRASHAASAPERGRSALDGVEAMNHMVNLLREHVPEATRLHYVITSGGEAPNVVPEFAEVFYYVRHPDAPTVEKLWDRVVAAAEGAATGTGTRVEYEVIHGNYNILPNHTLAKMIDANLRRVGGVKYDEAEEEFARNLRQGLGEVDLPLGSEREVQPFAPYARRSSTDVGDVSWLVPTAGFYAATWIPGTSSHSWQAVAAGGTGIGTKGMLVAVKTLALTAVGLFEDPSVAAAALAELQAMRGADYTHQPLLGDRQPPLDYRR
jgi:aminobenzoyl-glutamate utilization protein B